MWSPVLTATAVDFFAKPIPLNAPFTMNELVKEGSVRLFSPFFTETEPDDTGHRVMSTIALVAERDITEDMLAGDYRSHWAVHAQPLPLRDPPVGTYVFKGTLLGRRRLGNEIFFSADFGGAVDNNLPAHVEKPRKSSDPNNASDFPSPV